MNAHTGRLRRTRAASSSRTGPRLEAALAYAKKGWPIHPVGRDKRPMTRHGVHDATTNPETIEAWWKRWPEANIALDCAGAGMVVVDLDPGHDRAALDDLLPATQLRQVTPRGGEHLFYALASSDEIVSPSASKVAPHVDVRSFNSYVLLAPSETKDGAYTWTSEGKPALRSDALVARANSHRERSKDHDTWIIEPDLPDNIEAAIRWLKKDARPAIEGQGGDATAYATAAYLKSLGISEHIAFDLMVEHWNPRNEPPWRDDELEHLETKVANGYAYNTSPPGNLTGAYKKAEAAEAFKPKDRPLPSGREVIAGRFRMVDYEGLSHVEPPTWIVENLIAADSYAILFGAPGTFKSFIALDIALSIATGFQSEPNWPAVTRPGPVLYTAGEGRSGMRLRAEAWSAVHFGGHRIPDFVLADPVPGISEDLDPYLDAALDMRPEGYRLVVLDTIARSMQGHNQNAQEHASRFAALVDTIRRELGASVLAIHHSGHGDQSRTMGSMEFIGAADVSYRAERVENTFAVTLHMAKDHKDADPWPKPITIELRKHGESLVAVPPSQTVIEAAAPEAPKHKFSPSKDVFADLAIDGIVAEVLEANPSRRWTQKALAETVAMHERCEVSSGQLNKRDLPRLRENKAMQCHRFYDVRSHPPMWRWVSSAKGDHG